MQPAKKSQPAETAAVPTVSLADISPPPRDLAERSPSSTAVVQQSHASAVQATPLSQQVQIQPPVQVLQPQAVQPVVQSPIQQDPVLSQPVQTSSPVEPSSIQQAVADGPESFVSDHSAIESDLSQGAVMLLGEDFPDLAGAQPGCYGLAGCRQLSGNYRAAAKQLLAQLKAQGYQLTEREDIDNAGHRVFEAIAPNQPDEIYYLNVFSPDAGSTVYVMARDILSLRELEALSS